MTRWGHVSAVEQHVGFGRAGPGEVKELEGWLGERALEHDRPVTLFAMACELPPKSWRVGLGCVG